MERSFPDDSPYERVQTSLLVLVQQVHPDRVETALEPFPLETVGIHTGTEPVTAMRRPPEILAGGGDEELYRSARVDPVLDGLFPRLDGNGEHESPKCGHSLRSGVGVEGFSLDVPLLWLGRVREVTRVVGEFGRFRGELEEWVGRVNRSLVERDLG